MNLRLQGNDLSQVITELGQLAQVEHDFVKLTETTVDRVLQALQVKYVGVLERLNDGSAMRWCAGAGWLFDAMQPIPLSATLKHQLNWILEQPTPRFEAASPNSQPLMAALLQDDTLVSSMSVVIQSDQTPFGLLLVGSTAHRPFSELDILFLQAISQLLTGALNHQRAEAALACLRVAETSKQQLVQEVITLKRVEAILRESEERYALAANAVNDGVWDWNITTDKVYFSARWKAMLGYEDTEIANTLSAWFERLHPDDVELVETTLAHHREGLTSHIEVQYRLMHRDGTYRWMLCRGLAARDANGTIYRLAGCQTDITARKNSEDKLIYHALHDGLTSLANRNLFMDRLQHAISLAKRHADYEFAVIFLDLDRFKVINDSLGHVAGDQLLIAIAQRLKDCLRSSDTCARLGGDEFAILLEYVESDEDAIAVVDRIQKQLGIPIYLSGREVFVNGSIGVILSTMGYEQPEDLLRDVDTAMYRAKALGRGRYVVFTQEMHEQAVTLLQVESDLRRAIERDEFRVFYQPMMNVRTNKLAGFEALVRWAHPERGLIPPNEFIPVAEETGLILAIGRWVLREACQQIQKWQQLCPSDPPLHVSVNISRKQFSQPDLVQQIQTILHETGLNPDSLKLEITESALMDCADTAIVMMEQLKTLGVHLSMDDFGTGYSSLGHLHLFPIDTLKIDPSFVHQADTDPEKVAIIRTVISLAWNLGIDVVAEGIETKRQMSQLKLLKCDLAQGFLFSKPLSHEAVEAWIDNLPEWPIDLIDMP